MTPVKRRHKSSQVLHFRQFDVSYMIRFLCSSIEKVSQRHVPDTFMFKQLASLRKLEELAMKFEDAQISRKPPQVIAS